MSDRITQGELLDMPNPTPAVTHRRKALHDARRPREGLASILDEQAALARSLVIAEPLVLAQWFLAQLTAADLAAKNARLALDRGHWAMEGVPRLDPLWQRYWTLQSRYEAAVTRLEALQVAQHPLVCSTHGFAAPDAIIAATGPVAAIALHGLLTGEGALSWAYPCEQCEAPRIEARAQVLLEKWRQP